MQDKMQETGLFPVARRGATSVGWKERADGEVFVAYLSLRVAG
jgi:hypothetical protein